MVCYRFLQVTWKFGSIQIKIYKSYLLNKMNVMLMCIKLLEVAYNKDVYHTERNYTLNINKSSIHNL